MKTNGLKLLLLGLLITGVTACAHRYREASSGRSASEVGDMLSQITTSGTGTSSDAQVVLDFIRANPQSTVYFAEAPGAMGPIHAVTPMDLAYLTGTQNGIGSLDEIRTFFVELNVGGEHKNALIVQYRLHGQSTFSVEVYTNFTISGMSLGTIEDGSEFRAVLKNQAGRSILVRSFDIDEDYTDELAPVIQLELSAFNDDGSEGQNLGQISSMEGFSIDF